MSKDIKTVKVDQHIEREVSALNDELYVKARETLQDEKKSCWWLAYWMVWRFSFRGLFRRKLRYQKEN